MALALLVLGLGGCSEKPKAKSAQTVTEAVTNEPTADTSGAAAPVAAQKKTPAPGADEQVCFECQGTGLMTCNHTGCDHGFVECPGPCLKRSSKWEHAAVEGHPASELWHVIPLGGGHEQLISQAHIGEVFAVRGNQVERLGKCQQCNGRGRVACPTCKGKAQITCNLCEGKLVVPRTWSTNDNPVLNRQPDLIRLKDSRVFLGKRSELGDRVFIRTRDGKLVTLSKDDFPPAPEGK